MPAKATFTYCAKSMEQIAEPDGAVTDVRLGAFIDNTRRRADKLSEERRVALDALGMRR